MQQQQQEEVWLLKVCAALAQPMILGIADFAHYLLLQVPEFLGERWQAACQAAESAGPSAAVPDLGCIHVTDAATQVSVQQLLQAAPPAGVSEASIMAACRESPQTSGYA